MIREGLVVEKMVKSVWTSNKGRTESRSCGVMLGAMWEKYLANGLDSVVFHDI